MFNLCRISSAISLGLVFSATPVLAQITSTSSSDTTVNLNGQDWEINGGNLSADGANLFHNFQDFNLNSTQSATFFSSPTIQNILSRVNGLNPSQIDGLLRVSGSNANLYLLNPNGIVFGDNAQLDLSGSFTATTAEGIGFGENIWQGSENYAELMGNPNQFFFDGTGGIINGADLAVLPGQSINFFASEVINTGSLEAPSGSLNLVAVPETNTLRLSQVGQILNLEFSTDQAIASLVDIPALLTGTGLETGLNLENNQVILTETQTALDSNSGSLFVSGDLDVSSDDQGGNVSLLGNQVVLLATDIDASGTNGGGEVYVGGDYQGQGLFSNATNTFVDANSFISTEAIASGNGGKVILWADNATIFNGTIDASGGDQSGDGGFVEVSGKEYLDFRGLVDVQAPQGINGKLLLDPSDIVISNASNSPGLSLFTDPFSADIFENLGGSPSNLNTAALQNQLAFGDVIVSTMTGFGGAGNITVDSPISWSSGSALILFADNDIIIRDNIVTSGQNSLLVLDAINDIRFENPIIIGTTDSSTMAIDFLAGGSVQENPQVIFNNVVGLGGPNFEDFENGPFPGEDDFFEDGEFFGDDEFFGEGEFGDEFDDEGDHHHGRRRGEFGDDDDFFGDEEFGERGFEYQDDEWGDYGEEFEALEFDFLNDYGDYFNISNVTDTDFEVVQSQLSSIQALLDIEPAIIYAAFRAKQPTPNASTKQTEKQIPSKTEESDIIWQFDQSARQNFLDSGREIRDDDELELVMLSASGEVVRRRVLGVTRGEIRQAASFLYRGVTNPRLGKSYLRSAQYFYNLLIRPLENELEAGNIDNLTFVMDRGLRSLPIAALHDGEQFIIEKYSLGMMPSFSLTQTDYLDVRSSEVLAMGASEFSKQNDLPAVPVELSVIADQLWEGDVYLEEEFTVEQLLAARKNTSYGILHLATHGEFLPGNLDDSYIQFWDRRVSLTELPNLQLDNPPLELLVLSACRTAFGDPNAELGFAGLAIASGVKSALGSLWYVSDEGTLGLMTQFYQELQNAPIKAEALRQAQLALLRGEVYKKDNKFHPKQNHRTTARISSITIR